MQPLRAALQRDMLWKNEQANTHGVTRDAARETSEVVAPFVHRNYAKDGKEAASEN